MILLALPSDIARHIYLFLYFPWVLQELKLKYPENNQFLVHSHSPHSDQGFDTSSKSTIIEINTPLYSLYLFPFMIIDLYRKGISSHPTDLWDAYTNTLESYRLRRIDE
jgi:hypothetical protein